jgi:hypothetical protein
VIAKHRRDQRPISAALWAIGWAIDLRSTPVQDVGGDHHCSEFLDRPDVRAVLEPRRREGTGGLVNLVKEGRRRGESGGCWPVIPGSIRERFSGLKETRPLAGWCPSTVLREASL